MPVVLNSSRCAYQEALPLVRAEPFSTSPTEGAVQWLLHRRLAAQHQMRWSPRGAYLMLKVRTSIVNGTFDRDHAAAERCGHRPFRKAA